MLFFWTVNKVMNFKTMKGIQDCDHVMMMSYLPFYLILLFILFFYYRSEFECYYTYFSLLIVLEDVPSI